MDGRVGLDSLLRRRVVDGVMLVSLDQVSNLCRYRAHKLKLYDVIDGFCDCILYSIDS